MVSNDCKRCEINIGLQDLILKIDEKIIFHVTFIRFIWLMLSIVGGKINPDDVVDKIQLSLLEYVKDLVNSK